MEQSKFYQIKNVTEHEYTLVGCDGSVITRPIRDIDKSASAFTIQDAKDGDVLAESSCIFMIQKLDDNNTAETYCTLYNDGDFDDGTILYFDIDSTKPATKEQRNQLEKAMADAGYTFDFEKKELKKIEKKPVEWSEDEKIMKALVDVLNSDFEKDTEIHGITVGTIIAWLEKQSEQKHVVPKFKVDDTV